MSESNIVEKFEFNTSILTSYDGHEQRIKTRQYPRHYVSYKYDAMDASQAQWMRAQIRIRQYDVMYIPMWQNCVKLTEDHIGGYSLSIDPEYLYAFSLRRVRSFLFICRQSRPLCFPARCRFCLRPE